MQNVSGAPNPSQLEDFLPKIFGSRANITDPLLVVNQYECLVNILKSVSQKHGLIYLWELNKRRFARNIAIWKKCGPYDTAKGAV